jgi:hypothetical protein
MHCVGSRTHRPRHPQRSAFAITAAAVGFLALATGSAAAQTAGQTDLLSRTRDQNQWVMAPHDYASTRFSGLD